MRIPPDIIKNTEAFLALLSVLGGAIGLALVVLAYAAIFFSLQSLDSAVSPQIEAASLAVSDASELARSTAQTAQLASDGTLQISAGLSSYADSAKNASDSMMSIAVVPPFSLDSRFSSAAKGLRAASLSFANASRTMKASAGAMRNASSSLDAVKGDLGHASLLLSSSKKDFKAALFMLNIAAFAACFSLAVLFASLIALSVSILLSHYPRLFERSDAQRQQSEQPHYGQPPSRHDERYPHYGEDGHSQPPPHWRSEPLQRSPQDEHLSRYNARFIDRERKVY